MISERTIERVHGEEGHVDRRRVHGLSQCSPGRAAIPIFGRRAGRQHRQDHILGPQRLSNSA